MNKKYIILVASVLICTIIYIQIKQGNNFVLESKSDSTNKNETIIENIKTIEEQNHNLVKETFPKAPIEIDVKENNQQPLKFHQDSVLDYRIAVSKFGNCIQHFNPVKSFGAMKISKKKLTEKQSIMEDNFHNYCESIKSEYPYYFSKDVLSGFLQSDPNLKGLSGFDTFSEEKLFNIMKNFQNNQVKPTDADVFDIGSANAYSIIGAHNSLRTIFLDKVYPELSTIIGGNNQKYLTKIVEYAENKIGCSLGAECTANSNMMVNYCRKDESNCGLSFKQMYETRLSNGQLLDIQLTENYLIEFFAL